MDDTIAKLVDMLADAQGEVAALKRENERQSRAMAELQQRLLVSNPYCGKPHEFAADIASTNLISRVKVIRAVTGAGLREAKDAAERSLASPTA